MTIAVVEVGPRTVRGPGGCGGEAARTALAAIDDALAILGGEVVAVADLWHDVLVTAAAHADAAVLLCPTWWPAARVARLEATAAEVFTEFAVRQRISIVGGDEDAVLEVADDILVWQAPGEDPVTLDRATADLTSRLAGVGDILLDLPDGSVSGAADLMAALRARGVRLTPVTTDRLRRAALATLPQQDRSAPRRRSRRTTVPAAAAVVVALAVAARSLIPHPAPDAAALVDGRVSIRIPADWSVERITGGPGSDRLHAAAPGGSPSLHLTQSTGDAATTPQQLAETLGTAMRSEAVGVFTDLAATATDDGRPAVTYREHRAGATTVWTVVLAGEVRIALGCQTPDEDVPEVCAEAVRSAHTIR